MATPDSSTAKRRRSGPLLGNIIPEEIFVSEILVRLPVKSILRFRSVCRSWRTAMAEPRFVRRHLELSASVRPPSVLDVPCEPRLEEYWAEARSSKDQLLEFRRIWPGPGSVHAELMHAVPSCSITAVTYPMHCDGLVLVPTSSGEIFLTNPATREFLCLPRGSPTVMEENPVAFGFDPWTGTYKVARCFYRNFEIVDADDKGPGGIEYDLGHEVFTVGGESWEETDDPPNAIFPRRPICLPGNFYWSVAAGRADGPRRSELLRFCCRDNTFTVVPNPPCFTDTEIPGIIGDRDTFTELGGRLCCAHARAVTAVVDIWLANDGPCLKWSIAYSIELLHPVQDRVLPLAMINGDEVLLSVDRSMLYRYKATSGTLEEVVDMQRAPDLYGAPKPKLPLRFLHHAVPYVESLVSIYSKNM